MVKAGQPIVAGHFHTDRNLRPSITIQGLGRGPTSPLSEGLIKPDAPRVGAAFQRSKDPELKIQGRLLVSGGQVEDAAYLVQVTKTERMFQRSAQQRLVDFVVLLVWALGICGVSYQGEQPILRR